MNACLIECEYIYVYLSAWMQTSPISRRVHITYSWNELNDAIRSLRLYGSFYSMHAQVRLNICPDMCECVWSTLMVLRERCYIQLGCTKSDFVRYVDKTVRRHTSHIVCRKIGDFCWSIFGRTPRTAKHFGSLYMF